MKDYDYSQPGYYFITICVEERKPLLWTDVGAITDRPLLTQSGNFIETALKNIEIVYSNISLDEYVIMPNHIHFILIIDTCIDNRRPMIAPEISRVIQQFKGFVTKNCKQNGFRWQKSFYEHIIRNEQELQEIREYIINNPAKWDEDKYFVC